MRKRVIPSQRETGKENGLNLSGGETVPPRRGLSLCGVTAGLVSPGCHCHPSLPPLVFTCAQEPRRTFARRRVSGIRRGWVQRGQHAGEQPMQATTWGRCDPSLRSSGASRSPPPPPPFPGVPTQARTAARRARLAAAPARRKGKEKAHCVISPRFSRPAERGRLPRPVPLRERLPCGGILIAPTPKQLVQAPAHADIRNIK